MLTDREIFIAALASIEINGEQAARRASDQARRLEQNGNFRYSRQWGRVRTAILEIQRLARLDGDGVH